MRKTKKRAGAKRARPTSARPTELFPPLRPRRTGELRVSRRHTLYWEESGNPDGQPVAFLHGGPGGASDPDHRRFFDPQRWRIVLHDQRGCGKSRPFSELRENTTQDLVADVERLRLELGIERWVVFGGSWGSTLALAYAQEHPERVKGLVLRGIFLARRRDLAWSFQEGGASQVYPDAWDAFVEPIPPRERGDMLRAYHRRLTSRSPAVRARAARTWSTWETSASRLRADPKIVAQLARDPSAESVARLECHYFTNGCFLERDDQLLRGVKRIRHIPCTIVQGRYDMVCPMRGAWDLARAWPEARLVVVPDAGHSSSEPGTTAALVSETHRMASLR